MDGVDYRAFLVVVPAKSDWYPARLPDDAVTSMDLVRLPRERAEWEYVASKLALATWHFIKGLP
jgi:hypothetical protein